MDSPAGKQLIRLSAELAAKDERFSDWASLLGMKPIMNMSDEMKVDKIAELDALAGLLLGLSAKDIEHVFATFHRGWDYKARLGKVLEYYEEWKDK